MNYTNHSITARRFFVCDVGLPVCVFVCLYLVRVRTLLNLINFCRGSNPVLIALPPELAGMSLESRLISYNWKQNFNSFQQVTRNGSFKAICWDARNVVIPVSLIFQLPIYILWFGLGKCRPSHTQWTT